MNSSTIHLRCRHRQLLSSQTIWLQRHLITVCCMFCGFQWRTKVQLMGWEIVAVHWGMTDLCNWWAQRVLCKKPSWINIHDVSLNLITISKQVERTITVILLSTDSIFCLLYQQTLQNVFFFIFQIPFLFHFLSCHFLSSHYSSPFICCFYPYVIVHV